MKYALVLIGAHNGEKTKHLVAEALSIGPVLLVEPVPWLFASLHDMYRDRPDVRLLNCAVVETEVEEVAFYAPTREATRIANFGDQLGSLSPDHAISVHRAFEGAFEEITVPAISMRSLLRKFEVEAIDNLITDTEGYDARLLATFPFEQIKPPFILFEFIHSDGAYHIGKHLAHLLLVLEGHGYRTRALEGGNCRAVLQV